MYIIEKNIPVAPIKKPNPCAYPWEKMEVGDSIHFDREEGKRARAACAMWARRHGKVFRTRTTEEGIRIWRVA